MKKVLALILVWCCLIGAAQAGGSYKLTDLPQEVQTFVLSCEARGITASGPLEADIRVNQTRRSYLYTYGKFGIMYTLSDDLLTVKVTGEDYEMPWLCLMALCQFAGFDMTEAAFVYCEMVLARGDSASLVYKYGDMTFQLKGGLLAIEVPRG